MYALRWCAKLIRSCLGVHVEKHSFEFENNEKQNENYWLTTINSSYQKGCIRTHANGIICTEYIKIVTFVREQNGNGSGV